MSLAFWLFGVGFENLRHFALGDYSTNGLKFYFLINNPASCGVCLMMCIFMDLHIWLELYAVLPFVEKPSSDEAKFPPYLEALEW